MVSRIDAHMCAREVSSTPDSSRPQTFQQHRVCLRSEHTVRPDIQVANRHIAFEWPIRTRHHHRALTCSRYEVRDRAQ